MASNKENENQDSKRRKLESPPARDSENHTIGEGNSSFGKDRSRLDDARLFLKNQFSYNISRTSLDIARLVIKNQIPLKIVENEDFSILIKNLQPMFKLPSRATLLSAIIEVYQEEKGRLVEYFKKLPNFLHLRITLWKDDVENIIYCCYSVHFVDENWELKKKIIALKNLGHGNEFQPSILVDKTKSLLADWNFVNKLTSVTLVDAAFSSDKLADELGGGDFWGENTFVFIANICSEADDHGIIEIYTEWLVEIYDKYNKELIQGETREYPYMNAKRGSRLSLSSKLVAVAAILDPRYKLALVEFLYYKLYGNSIASLHLKMIHSFVNIYYNIYVRDLYRGTIPMQDDDSLASLNGDIEEDTVESFQRWYDSKRNKVPTDWKSELDKYLEEQVIAYQVDDEFKVLDWWEEHASKYPILGRMACDYLTLPFEVIIYGSSAANEKAMMDNPILKGLDPITLEAIICANDWLEMESPQQNVKLKGGDQPPAYQLELNHLSSESDHNEIVPSSGKEDLKSKAIAWSEKDVRTYLVSPFTNKEQQHLNLWQSHRISRQYIRPDKISVKALQPLLMIPPQDVNLQDARNYYIDDTVENRFFILLKRRYDKFAHMYVKHHSFDSSMATFLIEGSKSKSDMLSWVKHDDLKGTSKFFLPMCLNEHWLLFCADIDKKKLLWLDSSRHSQMSHASEKNAISDWFLDFLLPSLGYHQPNEWSHEIPKDIPMQKNSVDCALFVMKYADCLTHGDHFPFTQDDMPHFRHSAFLDLSCGSVRSGCRQA